MNTSVLKNLVVCGGLSLALVIGLSGCDRRTAGATAGAAVGGVAGGALGGTTGAIIGGTAGAAVGSTVTKRR